MITKLLGDKIRKFCIVKFYYILSQYNMQANQFDKINDKSCGFAKRNLKFYKKVRRIKERAEK